VLELSAGSRDQTVLPFTGISYPRGITVDRAGTVYVVDHSRVVKLLQH
jgi:serine/threonine-protein kinase